MKLTNPQVAALVDHLRDHYAFAGSIGLRHLCGIDPETEVGDVDVQVFHDGEEIDSFEVSTVGGVVHYA